MFKPLAVAAALAVALLTTACSSSEPAKVGWSPARLEQSGYHQLQASTRGFEVGSRAAAQTVYVLFDPQCPHCGHMWDAAQPLLNQVHMVWVPVGILSPLSAPQGAVLVDSTDPFTSMNAHEASIKAHTGGILDSQAHADTVNAIKANTRLFNEMGFDGVPVLVFQDTSGKTHTVSGSLNTAQLAQVLGLRQG